MREAFAIYERGAPELRAIRNEPDVHPRVAEAGESRGLAHRTRRRGRRAVRPPADRAILRAMIDLNTWQALRDQGLGPTEAVDAVSQMLAARVPADKAHQASPARTIASFSNTCISASSPPKTLRRAAFHRAIRSPYM